MEEELHLIPKIEEKRSKKIFRNNYIPRDQWNILQTIKVCLSIFNIFFNLLSIRIVHLILNLFWFLCVICILMNVYLKLYDSVNLWNFIYLWEFLHVTFSFLNV